MDAYDGPMTTLPKDPLAATDRLLIDGSNLLHALTRGSGAGAAPPAAVIGRLRGVAPASVQIDLVFDGPAERSLRGERIAPGLVVRYSGPRTGDEVILTLVDEISMVGGAEGTAAVLVVTDDRELRHRLKTRGARTAGCTWWPRSPAARARSASSPTGCTWLIGRLERPSRKGSAMVGNARPPHQRLAASATPKDGDEPDRPGWQTGRGATTKKGNPRRAPKGSRESTDRPTG